MFSGVFARMFRTLNRLHGEPECRIIEPVANWDLDSGVEYDPHQDQFVDGDGDPVTVDWTEQPHECVAFIPAPRNTMVALAIPGIVSTASTERNIVLKWCEDTQTRVAECWGVAIGDDLYRVREWLLVPDGVTTPTEIRVSLVEA